MATDARRSLVGALANLQWCLKSKIPPPRPKRPSKCPLDPHEQEKKDRYDRLKAAAPEGFHEVLELIVRAVVAARPLHLYLFIADLLDAELSRRTFNDIMYGCKMKKSLKVTPYPTESCMILTTWIKQCTEPPVDDSQFLSDVIPQYGIDEPALDRYREFAGIGPFDPCEEESEKAAEREEVCEVEEDLSFPDTTCVPERAEVSPAVDRYREFAGIGPFDPEDVEDECFDYLRHKANCTCTFCTLQANKGKPVCGPVEKAPQRDPCERRPTRQTLYIEQPVYREPQFEQERLFKERNIKAYEPRIVQDEFFVDDGLQPPNPFKEHPCDRELPADSPMEDAGDDPSTPAVDATEPVVEKEKPYCEEPPPEPQGAVPCIARPYCPPMPERVAERAASPEPIPERPMSVCDQKFAELELDVKPAPPPQKLVLSDHPYRPCPGAYSPGKQKEEQDLKQADEGEEAQGEQATSQADPEEQATSEKGHSQADPEEQEQPPEEVPEEQPPETAEVTEPPAPEEAAPEPADASEEPKQEEA